jgi:hypothetical protein
MQAMLRTSSLIAGAVVLGALSATLPNPAHAAAKEPSAGQQAARERQKRCSIEWKEAKAAKTLPAGARWPQFWSECNKRAKGAKA